jgi:hypothetical protein
MSPSVAVISAPMYFEVVLKRVIATASFKMDSPKTK